MKCSTKQFYGSVSIYRNNYQVFIKSFMSTVNWKIFELKIFHKQKFGVKKCSYTDRLGKFVTRWQKGDVT